MKCTCPKCKTRVDLELPEISDKGSSATCPQCKASFRVQTESFAGRAFRKSGEICCASCGHDLGAEIRCEACGIVYPEYVVAGGRRKDEPKAAGAKAKGKGKKQEKLEIASLEDAIKGESKPAAKGQSAAGRKQLDKRLALALILILLLAGGAFGAISYSHKKAETAYRKNFALATYGIQVEADKSRKICQKIGSDWKAGAGTGYLPRPTSDEEKDLNSIKTKLEAVKSKMAEEPEKYKTCNDKLAKLELAANKLRTLAVTPGSSLTTFSDSLGKFDAAYNKAAAEFKGGLPSDLMNELVESAKNFRGLRPLLNNQ